MEYLPRFTPFLWASFVGKYSSTMEHMGEAISGQTRDRFDRFNGDLAGNTCGFFHPTWIILGGKKNNHRKSPFSRWGHPWLSHTHRIHGAGICANIWCILMVNVTIYSIHGSYGIYNWVWNTHMNHLWFVGWSSINCSTCDPPNLPQQCIDERSTRATNPCGLVVQPPSQRFATIRYVCMCVFNFISLYYILNKQMKV